MDERFGPYRLIAHLGRGGMGDVFKAQVIGPGGVPRTVALKKVILPLSRNRQMLNMLVEEAKIAAKLLHPNIIYIHNNGFVNGVFFIEMEYLRGSDLLGLIRAALKDKAAPRLPPPMVAAYIGREIACGLGAAHEYLDKNHTLRPIVHCDISLQNVMLSYDGRVKIIDFGIAKVFTDKSQEAKEDHWLSGKVGYMAPEQITEGVNTPQTDIYAAGVVLYQLLTGRRPFVGSKGELVNAREGLPWPKAPILVNPSIGLTLSNIVMKAMAARPDNRYQRAADLARDLDRLLKFERFSAESVVAWMKGLLPEPAQEPTPPPIVTMSQPDWPRLAEVETSWEEEDIVLEGLAAALTAPGEARAPQAKPAPPASTPPASAPPASVPPPPVPAPQSKPAPPAPQSKPASPASVPPTPVIPDVVRDALRELQDLSGFQAAALVDEARERCLLWHGDDAVAIDKVAACAAIVLREVRSALHQLAVSDPVVSITEMLEDQLYLTHPLQAHPSLFLLLILQRSTSVLTLAQFALADLEPRIQLEAPP